MSALHVSILAAIFLLGSSISVAADDLRSSRLRELEQSLQHNESRALQGFWNEMEKRHTPLIEAMPGRIDRALYTFLWRGEPGQDFVNVRLVGSFPRPQ